MFCCSCSPLPGANLFKPFVSRGFRNCLLARLTQALKCFTAAAAFARCKTLQNFCFYQVPKLRLGHCKPKPDMLPCNISNQALFLRCSFSPLPGASLQQFAKPWLLWVLKLPEMLRCSFSPLPGATPCTCLVEGFETACWPIRPRPDLLPCSFGALPGANPSE